MSPKATEGIAAREAPTPFSFAWGAGDLRARTPSDLPGISPSRGDYAFKRREIHLPDDGECETLRQDAASEMPARPARSMIPGILQWPQAWKPQKPGIGPAC
ncbi:hypothetical protein ABID26_005834 [Mesorhizobium shonense]|uniref:Uncharacterized protein n=1 Tax=Mesorhizobium shonense TaxID=1209948 RepID=A0ABV2I0H6_9HYPH